MRILYFSRDYTPHDHRFLAALAQTEYKVYFLRLERSEHQTEDRPLPPEIEQIQWAGGRAPASVRDGPRLLLDLKRVIRTVKPDLIQAGPIQRSAFLAAISGFQPLLTMSWGYDLLFDANRDAWWRWATRFTLKRSAVLVGDCNTIRQLAISFGMPDERIVTFPWGVDIRHFGPTHEQFSVTREQPETFTLLSTRGWEPIYGVDVIARAFVAVARQRPELRLVMLGNGSMATRLRQIFMQGGVEDRVVFPGHVGHADLPRFYQMADLYLSASHSDGSSISLLEAMACGRPVLVSDIPGNCEWVRPSPQVPPSPLNRAPLDSPLLGGEGGSGKEEVGWLFPDGDASALAQAILHALEMREGLQEMGRNARALAVQRADWEKNFQEMLKAYELAILQS